MALNKLVFRDGSRLNGDAEAALSVCQSLYDEGNLNAAALVDVSRPKDAPLHDYFEWNNAKAAEEYRKAQARHIIRCIEYVDEETGRHRPAFVNVEVEVRRYEPLEVVLQDADKTADMLRKAYRDFEIYRGKYGMLKALAPVFDAMDQIEIPEMKKGGRVRGAATGLL